MKYVEKAILRFANENKIWLTPSNIAKSTGYGRNYIHQECRNLLNKGYLESGDQPGSPSYRITDAGRDYLNSES